MTQSATVKRYTLCYRCGVTDYKRRPDCNHPGNSKPMVLASDYDAIAAQLSACQARMEEAEKDAPAMRRYYVTAHTMGFVNSPPWHELADETKALYRKTTLGADGVG